MTEISTHAGVLQMPDAPGLYIAEFPNGKVYVGGSRSSIRVRALNHFTDARRGRGTLVCAAIRKYEGVAIFKPLLLCDDSEVLGIMEQRAIKVYGALAPEGYNIERGGFSPGPQKGYRHSDATRQKMSDAKKGKPFSSDKRGEHHRWSDAERAILSTKLKARGAPHWAIAKLCHPVRVEGVVYESINAAARDLSVSSTAVRWRIASSKFMGWSHV